MRLRSHTVFESLQQHTLLVKNTNNSKSINIAQSSTNVQKYISLSGRSQGMNLFFS